MKKLIVIVGLFLVGCSTISRSIIKSDENVFDLCGQPDSNMMIYVMDNTKMSFGHEFEYIDENGNVKKTELVFMSRLPDIRNINFDNAIPQIWFVKNKGQLVLIGLKNKDINFKYYF